MESENSFSSYNNIKRLSDEELIQVMDNEKNFDSLYNKYLRNCINPYYLFSDSEDDSSNFQNQLKNFQYSHKQFLKQKRGHN